MRITSAEREIAYDFFSQFSAQVNAIIKKFCLMILSTGVSVAGVVIVQLSSIRHNTARDPPPPRLQESSSALTRKNNQPLFCKDLFIFFCPLALMRNRS